MYCYNHPDAAAVGTCTVCGKAVCQACAVEMGNKLMCKKCAGATASGTAAATANPVKGADEIFCRSCGAVIKKEAEICPKCGVRQQSVPGATSGGKSRVVAAILAILLGTFGIHKFYLGKPFQGLIYLVLCWTGLPLLVGIVEGVIYLMATDEEFEKKYAH
jgi:hypothetical protein